MGTHFPTVPQSPIYHDKSIPASQNNPCFEHIPLSSYTGTQKHTAHTGTEWLRAATDAQLWQSQNYARSEGKAQGKCFIFSPSDFNLRSQVLQRKSGGAS